MVTAPIMINSTTATIADGHSIAVFVTSASCRPCGFVVRERAHRFGDDRAGAPQRTRARAFAGVPAHNGWFRSAEGAPLLPTEPRTQELSQFVRGGESTLSMGVGIQQLAAAQPRVSVEDQSHDQDDFPIRRTTGLAFAARRRLAHAPTRMKPRPSGKMDCLLLAGGHELGAMANGQC
jgi:hypothetical protein